MILLVLIVIAILAAMLAEIDAPTLVRASEPARQRIYQSNPTRARCTGQGPPQRGEEKWVLWTVGI